MVLWALAAAYSHYYALVAVGIMMFFTGVAVWIKYRWKTWIKGVLAIVAFFIGYAPWLYFFYAGLKNVSRGWWMTEILGLDQSLEIVMGGRGMNRIPVGDSVSGGDPGSGFFCILCGKRRSTYAEAFCEKLV